MQVRCHHCLNVMGVYRLFPERDGHAPRRYYECRECGETATVIAIKAAKEK